MVVFHHVLDQSDGFRAILPTQAGQAGVDLFFVISGFVMVYVTVDRERSASQFLAMRAARIIPVYWFYTLAAALLMLLIPSIFRANELSVRHVVLSLLFVPHETASAGVSPIIKQGWTLNYEVFFYVLFAIAMAFSARRRVSYAVGVLVVFAVVGYWMLFAGISLGTADFYFQNIVLEFAFGMLIAQAFLNGLLERLRSSFGAVVAVAGFVAMFALDPIYTAANRSLVYGLPAAAIVVGALAFEGGVRSIRVPLLQFAGDASYSIYLVHGFPVALLRTLWRHGPLPMAGAPSLLLFLFIALLMVMLLGAMSYYAIERTSLKYLRRLIQRYVR